VNTAPSLQSLAQSRIGGTTFWLVRHGETASNAQGVFQGQLDVGLNARGESQADAVAARLANTPLRRVYASDLSRAARTAEIIAAPHGLKVQLDPDLREMHYGVLQGVAYRDAPTILEAHGLADAWGAGLFSRRGIAPPGGESARQLRNRAARFVRRMADEHPPTSGDHILVVAHGGLLRVLTTVLLGLPLRARICFGFANCGLSRVVVRHDSTVLEAHNEIAWCESRIAGLTGLTAPGTQLVE
jgi:broad specificity phosphatase PhoE